MAMLLQFPKKKSNNKRCLDCIDIDQMKPFQRYGGNKQGTLSFTIVSPEHIEDERTSTAVKLGNIVQHRRKVEQTRVNAAKKAKRDAFYSALAVKLTIPRRELYARNADKL